MAMNKRLVTGVALGATGLCLFGLGALSAATPSSIQVVKACSNSSGVLVLASSRGGCASGLTKVSLGHGAYPLRFHAARSVTSATRKIGGYSYHEVCTISGAAAARTVETEIIIGSTPGVTYTVSGPVMEQNRTSVPPSIDTSPITTVTDNFTQRTSTSSFYATATAGHFSRFWYDLTVSGSDNSVQQVRFRLTVNNVKTVPAGEQRCMIDGTILPTANA